MNIFDLNSSNMDTVRTYPTIERRKTMPTGRSNTEPIRTGFMQSVMKSHRSDDLDEGFMLMSAPAKKITQQDQDEMDEKARRRAMSNLVNSWQERLQLITVITTFFASTEAVMLTNSSNDDFGNSVLNAANASLLGALIVHVYAAVLSFLGAFLLIRYKLQEATREEMIVEGVKMVNSPLATVRVEGEKHEQGQQGTIGLSDTQSTYKGTHKRMDSSVVEPPIISANPHLEQVGLFMSNVSSHLLSRTHSLCVYLTAAGFVLAIVGIMCYAWGSQPLSVSIFASSCFGVSVVALVVLLL